MDKIEIYPDVVHTYLYVDGWVWRDSFQGESFMYSMIIEKDGNWVEPVLARRI